MSADVRLFGSDGKEIDDGYRLPYGSPVTLAAGGEYRVVITPFGIGETTFTVWDAKDTPAEVLQSSVIDGCGPTCSSSGSGSSVQRRRQRACPSTQALSRRRPGRRNILLVRQ